MVSMYSANCAAFATVQSVSSPIASVEDLARQTQIKYGVLKGGSTESFFRNSNHRTYEAMWSAMESSSLTAFASNTADGIHRVVNGNGTLFNNYFVKVVRQIFLTSSGTFLGKFAFLMESAAIEYITERRCELTQVGGLLDSKNYGIAMTKSENSVFRTFAGVVIDFFIPCHRLSLPISAKYGHIENARRWEIADFATALVEGETWRWFVLCKHFYEQQMESN